jgi:hypothetical protein
VISQEWGSVRTWSGSSDLTKHHPVSSKNFLMIKPAPDS